jgi:hypothetical protein
LNDLLGWYGFYIELERWKSEHQLTVRAESVAELVALRDPGSNSPVKNLKTAYGWCGQLAMFVKPMTTKRRRGEDTEITASTR